MISSLLHHSDGQQPFRMFFALQRQRNLRESYAVLIIYPMMAIQDPPWTAYKEQDGHQRMDLSSFSLGKACEKLPKSIPMVTIFLLIGMPWWMLCLP